MQTSLGTAGLVFIALFPSVLQNLETRSVIKTVTQDFPGGAVLKTCRFHCSGAGWIPGGASTCRLPPSPPALIKTGGREWTNLDIVLKNRDITLPTEVHLVKAMVFPVVIHGCESWTRRLSTELMLSNCGAGEDLESPLDCKEIKPVHPKGNQF